MRQRLAKRARDFGEPQVLAAACAGACGPEWGGAWFGGTHLHADYVLPVREAVGILEALLDTRCAGRYALDSADDVTVDFTPNRWWYRT